MPHDHAHDPHHDHRHADGHDHVAAGRLHASASGRPHVHHHPAGAAARRALTWALALTALFAGVEIAGGVWSGSLALLSDAGHMVTDALALGLALFAQVIARRPPSARNSFGYARAEVIGAFVNAVAMLAVVALIAIEAVQRLLHPSPVAGGVVVVVAATGLAVNLVVAWLLHGQEGMNSQAAYLHVLGDALGSIAALAAGAIVWATGWLPADPLLSLGVSLLLLASTWRLLRRSINVLMEGVPQHLSYLEIGEALAAISHVDNVHDLHVWYMSAERVALSAHVLIDEPGHWPAVLRAAKHALHERFGIDHVTLQPGWPDSGRRKGGRVIRVAASRT